MVKREVNFYVSDRRKIFNLYQWFQSKCKFPMFVMSENETEFIILPMQVNFLLIWKWLLYIVHNLENYSSEHETLYLNQDTNLKRVTFSTLMHEVMYSTNNNIYVAASYTKIVIVEGCYLIWKPSLDTSLCMGMGYTNDHTPPKFPTAYPRVFESLEMLCIFLIIYKESTAISGITV